MNEVIQGIIMVKTFNYIHSKRFVFAYQGKKTAHWF